MKNKLMGLFALASCVVLSGCGEPPEPVYVTIKIADLPTNLVEGDSIELKDYITVSGGQGDYSINFDDESFAKITKVSDTQITLNEYGSIKFTVDYSGKSVEGTIAVGSALLNGFAESVKNAGYDYAEIYFDDEDYPHWENYGEKFMVDCFYSEESYGGYLEAPNGIVYSFEETFGDDDKASFSFSLTGYEPAHISDYSKPLNLPTSGYEIVKEDVDGEIFEYLSLKDNGEGLLKRIGVDFFNLDGNSLDLVLSQYKMELSSFTVNKDVLEFDEEESMDIYDTYLNVVDKDETSATYGEEFYLVNTMLSFDKDKFFRDEVQAYIDSGEQPKSSYELDVEDIAAAVNKHNYTISYDYGWYKCSFTPDGMDVIRGKKLTLNPFITEEQLQEDGYYIVDFFNAIGGFNVYVGEDKVFSDVPHEDGYGLINKDVKGGKEAFEYSGNAEDGYKAKSEGTGFDLFHPENDYFYNNYQFLTGVEIDEYPSVYADLFVNEKIENKDGSIVYKLSGSSCIDLFDWLFYQPVFDGDFPGNLPEEEHPWRIDRFNSLNIIAEFVLTEEMTPYFDVSITEKYDGDEIVGLVFDFSFIQYDESATGAVTYYQYVMSASIDFTNCVMPEFDVQFPVEE